jgi:hypothetical protein
MAILTFCSYSSNDFHFKVTKLLFDYGADLDFKTFWLIDENGLAVVGQGDIEGNAVQFLQFIKEHQHHDKLKITTEHVDKVLEYLSKNRKVFFIF